MAIVEAKLKTVGAFTKQTEGASNLTLWQNIETFMDGETAFVMESSMDNGQYTMKVGMHV